MKPHNAISWRVYKSAIKRSFFLFCLACAICGVSIYANENAGGSDWFGLFWHFIVILSGSAGGMASVMLLDTLLDARGLSRLLLAGATSDSSGRSGFSIDLQNRIDGGYADIWESDKIKLSLSLAQSYALRSEIGYLSPTTSSRP